MSEQSDKRSSTYERGRVVSVALRARELIIAAAGPRDWDTTRARWLETGARRLRLSFARARAIFYGEARLIGAEEWEALQRRAAELNIKEAWEKANHERDSMDLRAAAVVAARPAAGGSGSAGPLGTEGARPAPVPAIRPARDA